MCLNGKTPVPPKHDSSPYPLSVLNTTVSLRLQSSHTWKNSTNHGPLYLYFNSQNILVTGFFKDWKLECYSHCCHFKTMYLKYLHVCGDRMHITVCYVHTDKSIVSTGAMVIRGVCELPVHAINWWTISQPLLLLFKVICHFILVC